MWSATLNHGARLRPPKPLVVRAGLRRTFGSLAGFTALGLLSLGVYLLADAFEHPVDAEAAAVIVAALAIALAVLLLFFLLRQRAAVPFRNQAIGGSAFRGANHSSASPTPTLPGNALRVDLPYQRAYVDRSRIRR